MATSGVIGVELGFESDILIIIAQWLNAAYDLVYHVYANTLIDSIHLEKGAHKTTD